ncbi:MAG: hypothetical protein K0S11_1070 [Gammaproteobacteria bacterium]|jgi:uncharacterized protein YlxP (DUF503 family)|nr:hypothetical protein [Gammaproteobacteria bacterium]
MLVGICTIKLSLPENHSLKGKRQILSSLINRTRNKFQVAIAEVDQQDIWQLATLGISAVSNEGRRLESLFSQIIQYFQENSGEYYLLDHKHEILTGF